MNERHGAAQPAISRRQALGQALAATLWAAGGAAATETPPAYRKLGQRALEWTRRVVEFGPRPPGSEAHRRLQELILEALGGMGCEVEADAFTAGTPAGPIPMKNILATFPGRVSEVVAVSGHYDTYHRPGLDFAGANDGGSSTGFLLAMAEYWASRAHQFERKLIFFDGEESIRRWSDTDSLYGSRRLAERWVREGMRERVRAVINVDMIGDADLELVYEGHSTPWLRDRIWETAHALGYQRHFPKGQPAYVEDDHVPLARAGFPAVDLIDFDYGWFNRYWHSERDTMDKLSAESFAVVLHVVIETLRAL